MNNLRILRKNRGIKQLDVAKTLNLSPQVYSNYENGLREPDFNTLIKLADYFNVSIDYLLGRTATQQPPEQPRFLTLYNSLTSIQQEKVVAFMEGLLAQ